MARLTRTQKYADLRDKIVQDREESLKTSESSSYEDRLRNLESFLNKSPETDLDKRVTTPVEPVTPVEPTPVYVAPVEPTPVKPVEPVQSVYTAPVVEPTPVVTPVQEVKPAVNEEIKKAEQESMKSLEDILNEMMNTEPAPIKEEPQVVETPVAPVEPTPVKPVEPVQSVYTAPVVEPTPVVTPVQEVKPVVNNEPADIMATMEIISEEVKEISNIIGEQETKAEEPTPVRQETLKVEPIVPIEIKAESNNSFISETFDEVNKYNLNAGRDTLDTLPQTLIQDVRNTQEQVEEKEEEKIEDIDFSNTVSLEIEKVLNEIGAQTETVEPVVEVPTIIPVEEAELENEEAFNNAEVKETFEHPVLTKTIEEPVVEIKNINDTLTNTSTNSNIIDDTIPFVVDKEEDEEYEDEDDEEEAPSKVLNVILGILIFVLVAVLGVIVYYILVAKGIIG